VELVLNSRPGFTSHKVPERLALATRPETSLRLAMRIALAHPSQQDAAANARLIGSASPWNTFARIIHQSIPWRICGCNAIYQTRPSPGSKNGGKKHTAFLYVDIISSRLRKSLGVEARHGDQRRARARSVFLCLFVVFWSLLHRQQPCLVGRRVRYIHIAQHLPTSATQSSEI
jgi:hypothetical protein